MGIRSTFPVSWRVLVLAVLFAAVGVVLPAGAEMTISQEGQGRVVIVVGSGAIESERYAAEELSSFLGQVCGGEFPIVDVAPEASRILVGPDAARLAVADFSISELGDEGLVIRTVGNDLILAGGRPRGTLYAVYTFLEEVVSCRWWSSKASTIPRKPTLVVDDLNIKYVPTLEYRESFWFDAFDGDWAGRNKCNGNFARLSAKQGGKHTYSAFVHSFFQRDDSAESEYFYSLIEPKTYFADHPEWFSLIDGKRRYNRAQLCLSNEEMKQELIKNLKGRLRQRPTATIASVSQNDNQNHCQCEKCRALNEREGSPAGAMIRFVNDVAAAIEEEFPHVAVDTLAYQYTRKPPKYARPRDNVIVRLCSIECSFSKPLSDEVNKAFREDIENWSKICDRLYIWDYVTNFRHYVYPHPNLRVLGDNVRFFVDHNVKGIFEQGAYQSQGGEMAELKAWVLAKLLWNPQLDEGKLIEEFLAGYYGAAGTYVGEYLDLIHDAVAKSGDKLGCFSKADAKFLTYETMARGWGLMDKALGAVAGDADLTFRVKVARLPIMNAVMHNWNAFRDQAAKSKIAWPWTDSIDEMLEEFKQLATKAEIVHLREHPAGFGRLEKAVEEQKK